MHTNQGQFLAALPKHFHELRTDYLRWADPYRQSNEVMLGHYRRALIGWYEASIDPVDPYVGPVRKYVQTVAAVYFEGALNQAVRAAEINQFSDEGEQDPLQHLPRPVQLNNTQQLMLAQFKELGNTCRELLLMTEYHRLNYARVAEVIKLAGQPEQVMARHQKCLLMVREAWLAGGITEATRIPGPVDEELIDRYYAGELTTTERWDVEARRPVDSVFRDAMERREDFAAVVTVAGRQDLMETLMREEAKYAKKRVAAKVADKVRLSPRRKDGIQLGKLELPNLQTLLAVGLFVVFCWLAFTTFGPTAPQRQSVANFEPYPNIFANFRPRDAAEEDLQRILYYYDRRDYRTAYDELLPVAQAYPAAPLYLGVSALALEQPQRAIDWFEQIPAGDYYHPPSEWYEALAYLATGNRIAGQTLLQDITETRNHPFRDRARNLLAKL